jgi:aspartyl-tRNA(Asn)/glutamyl-tRNA(Gln) amidotransferase subunit A
VTTHHSPAGEQTRPSPVPGRIATRPELAGLGIVQVARGLRAREYSAVELLAACQKRIADVNGGAPSHDGDPHRINAWVRLYPEKALAAARKADRTLGIQGADAPLMTGIPVGLKDIFAVQGLPLTASSRVLDERPERVSSTVWENLSRAGAVLVGHTHTHEFAFAGSCDQSGNPWNTAASPGGSSGGSAAAVAAGMVPAAVGTDTGGSVRVPAAFCGISAIRPSTGRIATVGVHPLAPTFDTPGPMARSVADAALLLSAMEGWDRRQPDAFAATGSARPLMGRRIALTSRPDALDLDPDVAEGYEQTQRALTRLGASVVRVDLPPLLAGSEDFETIFLAESQLHHRSYADRLDLYRASTRATLTRSAPDTRSPEYQRAQQNRRRESESWQAWMKLHRLDAVLEPVSPVLAPLRGYGYDPDAAQPPLGALVLQWPLLGFPVVAFPSGVGSRSRMPVGMALIGNRNADDAVIRLAIDLQERELSPLPAPPVAFG